MAYLQGLAQEWRGQPAWLPAKDLRPIDSGNVEHLPNLVSNYRALIAFRNRRFEPRNSTEAHGVPGSVPNTDVSSSGQACSGVPSTLSKAFPQTGDSPLDTDARRLLRSKSELPVLVRRALVKGSWTRDAPSLALALASTATDEARK